MTFQAGHHTDKGRRPSNQDAVRTDFALGYSIVADGMGGNAGGEEASRMAVDLTEWLLRRDLPRARQEASVPALLQRVIANLVSNALRYSPADRPVRVSAHHDADSVALHIIDQGPGIRLEDSSEVFRPFHRVGAQPDGGTGLGLAIVKGFAEAMGMTVELRPGDTGGLDARLVMPRWVAETHTR
jgi:signal transduction histidine kinase